MALRPDPGTATGTKRTALTDADIDSAGDMPEAEKEYLLSIREKRRTRPAGTRTELKRRDWTFREGAWASEEIEKRNKILLDKVSQYLRDYAGQRV
jgi:hypothetical protein